MKVHLDLDQCARNNLRTAKIRECRRMLMLGICLQNLGCDVTRNQPRVPYESIGMGKTIHPGSPTESTVIISTETGNGTVCMQTSVNLTKYGDYYSRYEMVLSHEYQRVHDRFKKLYPIPFPVHDKVVQQFIKDDTLTYYLDDNVGPIRETYSSSLKEVELGKVGFFGMDAYGRRKHLDTFSNIYSDLDVDLYQDGKYSLAAHEYLRRMSVWKAGIFLPGDTPKANRWSELALMGIPIIHVPLKLPEFQPRIHPPASKDNCILLDSWSDVDALLEQLPNSSQIAANATRDYIAGWSIKAQATEIIRRFESNDTSDN